MKFDITIKDCNAAEAQSLLGFLTNTVSANSLVTETVIQHPHFDSEKLPAPVPTGHVAVDAVLAEQYNKLPSLELDASGMPWNEAIHSSTKTKTAKGVWTRRRGVDDATFDSVEANLRAVTPAPSPVTPEMLFNRPSLPPLPLTNAPTMPVVNFSTLTQRITNGFAGGKINGDYLTNLCARVGLKFGQQINTLTDVMNNQAMIEYADYLITADNLC